MLANPDKEKPKGEASEQQKVDLGVMTLKQDVLNFGGCGMGASDAGIAATSKQVAETIRGYKPEILSTAAPVVQRSEAHVAPRARDLGTTASRPPWV